MVPGVFKAPRVFDMETLGVFNALAEHVRFGLKLELKHDVIIEIFRNHLAFF